MINNCRAGATLLLLSVAPVSAEQKNAERDPFEPQIITHESPVESVQVKGMVGDGERWHFWSTDKSGRWYQRDPDDPMPAIDRALRHQ